MALAFVEGKSGQSAATPITTTALTSNVAVGQLLVAYAGFDGTGTNPISGVTDNKGNTWTKITGMFLSGGSNCLDAWSTTVSTGHTGTGLTVSVAFDDSVLSGSAVVQYFNGFTGTPTLDKVKSQNNASSTTATSGASAATTQTVELVIGGFVHTGTISAYTLGAGYTNLTQQATAQRYMAMESLVTASTGAQTATATIAAARANIGGVATFYDLSAGTSASVTQVAATVTATGGTQTIATVQSPNVAQVAGTVTATGGAQAVSAIVVASASVTQVAGSVTATGGTQAVASVQKAAITQVAGTVTATGGTQTVATVRIAAVTQVAGTVTATGGTQTAVGIIKVNVTVTQVAATVTATGGTQSVFGGIQVNVSVSQVAATVTATGGTQAVRAFTPPVWVSPTIELTSGGKTLTDTSASKVAEVTGGGTIKEITSGTKTTTTESGEDETIVTGSDIKRNL